MPLVTTATKRDISHQSAAPRKTLPANLLQGAQPERTSWAPTLSSRVGVRGLFYRKHFLYLTVRQIPLTSVHNRDGNQRENSQNGEHPSQSFQSSCRSRSFQKPQLSRLHSNFKPTRGRNSALLGRYKSPSVITRKKSSWHFT